MAMGIRCVDGSLRRKGPQACSAALCVMKVFDTGCVRQFDGRSAHCPRGRRSAFRAEAPAQHPDAQVHLSHDSCIQ